jgi:hypothetical protein
MKPTRVIPRQGMWPSTVEIKPSHAEGMFLVDEGSREWRLLAPVAVVQGIQVSDKNVSNINEAEALLDDLIKPHPEKLGTYVVAEGVQIEFRENQYRCGYFNGPGEFREVEPTELKTPS